jgi:hypothetical protein
VAVDYSVAHVKFAGYVCSADDVVNAKKKGVHHAGMHLCLISIQIVAIEKIRKMTRSRCNRTS